MTVKLGKLAMKTTENNKTKIPLTKFFLKNL